MSSSRSPSVSIGLPTPSHLQTSSTSRPNNAIGVVSLQADKFRGAGGRQGLPTFQVALDVESNCRAAFADMRAAGIPVTSSGGIRPLNAPVSGGRIATSFHYTGRAIDLYIYAGMFDPADDPYVVVQDGSPKLWRVFARTSDPSHGSVQTLTAKRFHRLPRPNAKFVTLSNVTVTDRFVDLTALLAKHKLERIGSQNAFVANPNMRLYTAAEWWHFQVVDGLVPAKTTFGSLLDRVHSRAAQKGTPPEKFRAYKWNGKVFVP